MFIRALLVLVFTVFTLPAFSQIFKISGKVIDDKDASSLPGVTVVISKSTDSLAVRGGITDAEGNFEVAGFEPGTYSLRLEYTGYAAARRRITVADKDVATGSIKMKTRENELKSVTVKENQIRAEQKGDTSQFRADAFKTHVDASAEDLVTKMPGVTSDNTGVKVNGENVQQVYVDGKPFFGTDPTLALKNMPAEIVDKIQVFDKLSDQAMFTGFDDGSSQKTMNIVTKKGKSEGTFGKLYAGYGTDERYTAGGNINIFHGEQKISILGMSNNINVQNFSSEDLLGVSGGGGGRSRGGGGRGNFGGGGGGASNFMTGQQGGITNTNSFGVNYSDAWGKKIKVSGSYFFNGTDNNNTNDIARDYYTPNSTTNHYIENDTSESKNFNHRFNLKFEYTIDSFNSIIFTPGISFQENKTTGTSPANDSINKIIASITSNSTAANNSGYSSSNNLLIQHKFKKQRRTISLNISASLNDKTGDGTNYSDNKYYDSVGSLIKRQYYNQQYSLSNNGYTVSPNVTYTEPVGKRGQLMVNYNPSYTYNYANKVTNDFDTVSQKFNKQNDTFSNKYNSDYNLQRGGLSYRVGDRKLSLTAGANLQYATLNGERTYPNLFSLNKNFTSVLPSVTFNYRYSEGRNLRIVYRTNTSSPTITQLQDIVDISNPLLLKTGNPGLKQDYEHTFIIRYGSTKAKTARSLFFNLYANYVTDYVSNAIYSTSDYTNPVTNEQVKIAPGSQLTVPVNLNGYFNCRTFLAYGLPVKPIKCNLNLSGGFNYSRTPGLINNVLNYTNNSAPQAGVVLSSNISEQLDFTLSYNGTYNIVDNTSQKQANNNYYNHTAAFKINWVFKKHLVVNTNITENYYTSFSGTGTQDFYLWNAYIGYKFLKNNALEARISAYDLLKQNKSINRNVTENYVENSVTQVLQQYFIFQLTYTIRNFKGALPTEEKRDGPWDGHRH